jgi:SAM-dependent methyltransferase
MKYRHFAAFAPVCGVCRQVSGTEHSLQLSRVMAEEQDDVLEGLLLCPGCQREYPILDGIPLLLPGLRAYVEQNIFHLICRDDLSEVTESLLGDCCGPGSPLDQTRQQLSTYGFGHYGDLDPERTGPAAPSLLHILEEGLRRAGEPADGPLLDLGCSAGRTSFALAERYDRLVLGVDLNFAMLRLASRVLRRGEVGYPLRRVGVVYDRRRFRAAFPRAENVDFWACDAQFLPLPAGRCGLVASLNLLDCVASPYQHLQAIAAALRPGARAVIATPYDWSPGATAIEGWIGGHSQRGPEGGRSEAALRALLQPGGHPAALPGLALLAEAASLPWAVRIHDRSTMSYQVHLVVVQAAAAG